MKGSRFLIALVCLIGVAAFGDNEKDKEKERTEIRQMSQETLARLYKAEPSAKAAVERAYGYAVFSNTGIKILFGGSGNGEGVAIKNQGKTEIFMKMFEIQAGLGMGVKKFRVIFVFDNQKAFDGFVNSGWEFGGQASAAAKTNPEKGGSMARRGVGFRGCLDVSTQTRDWRWNSLARERSTPKIKTSTNRSWWSKQ